VTAVFAKQVSLTVTKDGDGSGTVSDGAHALDCGASCSATVVLGQRASLTAVPDRRSVFVRWTGGGCAGAKRTCTVTVRENTSIKATFALARATLSVRKSGSGRGTIVSAPLGIACGAHCSATFVLGPVRLTARPSAGSRFVRWTGGCAGTRNACVVDLSRPAAVTGVFARTTKK
jgi:hypothetical protein